MTGQQLINKIRRYTRTNSGNVSFDDSTVLEILNEEYGMIMAKIIQTTGDYNIAGSIAKTDFIEPTGLVEEDNGYKGEYPFPVDLLRPVRVEVSYDGTNYVRATEYDLNDNEDSVVNETATKDKPIVRFYRDSYVIHPLPSETVTNGIMVYYENRTIGEQLDGTNGNITTATSPALEEVFQPLLVWQVCVNYGMIFPEKDNPKWAKRAYGVEQDMLRFYSNKFGRTRSINPLIDDYS